MRVPVLTAVSDADREAALVAAFEHSPVEVVRRCVDLADLLASAAAGTARAVLLDADLRRLDRDALSRLAVHGLAVVGLTAGEDGERRLRRLGLLHLVDAAAPAEAIATAVVDAVTLGAPATPPATPPATSPALPEPRPAPAARGRVVAVWGPAGAPGRTTLAVNLAAEVAALGERTMLVDADVYGGAVAQVLGLLDEAPGLAAAARLANNGLLDPAALAEVALAVGELRVLTGITRADRWPELRPAAVEVVLDACRETAAVTVVDCAFCLEDERRNAATRTILDSADTVLAVGSADPVSLARLVRGLGELGTQPRVVVNRLRGTVLPGEPRVEITRALARYAGVAPEAFLPYDPDATDRALMRGQSLAEAAPHSPLRRAIAELAGTLAGRPAPARRGRLLLRR